MNPTSWTLRRQLVEAMERLDALGFNRNATGNMSVRAEDGFLVTPSGVPTRHLTAADMVFVEMDGTVIGRGQPSTEWRLHRDLYADRPEIGAVLHSHATACTTLAVLGWPIPAFHYMVAVAGGTDIRCAPYATFGTQELAEACRGALAGRKACLLAHHGMVAVGADTDEALSVAIEVEGLAEVYWRARQLGQPALLPDDEMARVLAKFEHYGRDARRGD